MQPWTLPVTVLVFVGSALLIGVAGTRLAREGDLIAARTRLGGLWFGVVFLALATSLPELATSVSAALLGAVDIAAGNLLGSSMANMLILALLTLLPTGSALFSRAALDQVLSASLAITLNCMAGAFVVARLSVSFAGLGLGSVVIISTYLLGARLLYRHSVLARQTVAMTELTGPEGPAEAVDVDLSHPSDTSSSPEGGADDSRSLTRAIIAFSGAALVIMAAAPLFAQAAERLAEIFGWSETLVGTTLVGLSTSLPEFVTSLAALRMGAFDLAVGNLFGSNSVNVVFFAAIDLAHRHGSVFAAIDPSHAISSLVAAVLMSMSLTALVYRTRRRFSESEPTGLALLIVYILGVFLIGVGG